MAGKEGCKTKPEAAPISDIYYLLGERNLFLLRKFQGRNVYGNHENVATKTIFLK